MPSAPESAEENTPTNSKGSPAEAKGEKSSKKEKSGAKVDMDWEDEEESTHVFEKQKHALKVAGPKRVDAASTALLAASGASARPIAPLPPPAVPAPPPVPAPVQTKTIEMTTPAPAPRQRSIPPDDYVPMRAAPVAPSSSGRIALILGALALLAVVGLGVYILMPRTGQLKIELHAKSGATIAKAEIFVDGKKVCETTPCVVNDLSPGSKSVRVILPDGSTTDAPALVEAGKENLVTVPIEDSGEASPQPSASASQNVATAGTGIKVGGQSGVKILVDGKEAGTIPATLTTLKPGDHTIKFDGGDDYESVTKSVSFKADEMKDLGDVKLKVLKGHLTLELKTTGAQVVLTSTQNGKPVEKKLNDSVWNSPPVKINIDTKDDWTVAATKKGFDDFKQDIHFDDGAADKTLVIELNETGKPPPPPSTAVNTPPPAGTGATTAKPADTSKPADTAAGGMGTLNIGSVPRAKVLLDGAPIGSTPIAGRKVSPGSHTVIFVFENGRKTVSVNVAAGKTATASAKGD